MNKLQIAPISIVALGLSVACAMPAREVGDGDVATRERTERAGDPFASAARDAYERLNDDFEELVTDNARLDGERAEAWAETRERILEARQELGADIERLPDVSRDDAEDLRARTTRNIETMTHHIERAKLLSNDGADFMSAAEQRLDQVAREIEVIQSNASRLPMEAREDASRSVEDLRRQRNDVEESVSSMADANPQEIERQRDDLADDIAALSADVQREGLELQAELEN